MVDFAEGRVCTEIIPFTVGCVNPASWLPLAVGRKFTQPRAQLLADPCTCLQALFPDLPLQELHGGDAAGGALGALQHGRLAPHPVHQDRVEVAGVERPVHHVHLQQKRVQAS